MKFLILLIVICCIFPGIATLLGNELIALVPAIEAFMPCLLVLVGIYLIVKSILK